MRKRLIASFSLLIILVGYTMCVGSELLFEAKSEKEISSWAKNNFGPSALVNISTDKVKILAVVVDVGFGVKLKNLHLYVNEKNKWKLILLRRTNLSELKIELSESKEKLLISSKSGDLIDEIPIRTLSLQQQP